LPNNYLRKLGLQAYAAAVGLRVFYVTTTPAHKKITGKALPSRPAGHYLQHFEKGLKEHHTSLLRSQDLKPW